MPDFSIDTTKVIKQAGQNPKKDVYYIPGFFRLKVKNFTQMNLDNLDAQMNATIIFSVYYGDLDKVMVTALEDNIILLFGRDDALKLTEKDNLQIKMSNKGDKKQIQFTVRKLFHLRIESDVFWSPFQIINLILSITVQPVVTSKGTVKVNLLSHHDGFLKLSYTEEGTFGNYDLAESYMRTEYTNDRVYKIQEMKMAYQEKKYIQVRNWEHIVDKKSKIESFQYVHFHIPLYKFPIVALATIFLPLWLLAIINLGIFFQDNNLADRIASIAALMIAFVALIPTIRDQIPPNPKIVFIQILVYCQTLTSLFALIHSLDVRKVQNLNDVFLWYENGLFMVSFIITVLTIIIVILMMILHYFIWQPSYNRNLSQEKQVKFKRQEWKHELCDIYYSKVLQKSQGKIKLKMLADPPAGKNQQ